jgi:hypothetical protein
MKEFKNAEKEVNRASRSRFLKEVISFNVTNFRKASIWVRMLVLLGLGWLVFSTWYMYETRHVDKSLRAECERKCHPIPGRIEVTLLNPFLGEGAYRNIRSSKCVCGVAQ